ncbi:hypothetical protein [Terriglobus tenax]|uniref:hypothetical protein n=1 Tax=Terriglobus tenax TaxID=1111115 RepID=UPI0021DFC495|nr:hypothetical protein [Terriglobus tenax]
MSSKQPHSPKQRPAKMESTHNRSYAAHTGTDGMQPMTPQSIAGAGNGKAEHKNAQMHAPEYQGRTGKSRD